jgi:predicted nucleic acid-binding protein
LELNYVGTRIPFAGLFDNDPLIASFALNHSLGHVTFDQRDAEGFIRLNSLRLRLAARRRSV